MMDIQTILVEANEQTRVNLRASLRAQPGIEVASEATNGTTGLVLLESIDVDVAVVAANLPDMSLLEFIQQMHELQAETTVKPSKLLLLVNPTTHLPLLANLSQCVEGYCSNQAAIEQIATAIRCIHSGENYQDPALIQILSGSPGKEGHATPKTGNPNPFEQFGAFI